MLHTSVSSRAHAMPGRVCTGRFREGLRDPFQPDSAHRQRHHVVCRQQRRENRYWQVRAAGLRAHVHIPYCDTACSACVRSILGTSAQPFLETMNACAGMRQANYNFLQSCPSWCRVRQITSVTAIPGLWGVHLHRPPSPLYSGDGLPPTWSQSCRVPVQCWHVELVPHPCHSVEVWMPTYYLLCPC